MYIFLYSRHFRIENDGINYNEQKKVELTLYTHYIWLASTRGWILQSKEKQFLFSEINTLMKKHLRVCYWSTWSKRKNLT